ncbi:MAG: hypothetical protein JW841_18580 [Deltaproteobacteria bacterium]|nr:hypothetical protein [Deltaproteobacteria bacterium]
MSHHHLAIVLIFLPSRFIAVIKVPGTPDYDYYSIMAESTDPSSLDSCYLTAGDVTAAQYVYPE